MKTTKSITRAFCVELQQELSIVAARREYFSQELPRARFNFLCSSEACRALGVKVTGVRSTHASLRQDRHWRNLRTQTLHDPVDYKLHELGDWALNHSLPIPTFYS